MPPYTGRFAPSPTGLLHAGSLVAALASWLDARAHGGRWLVRIEDVDRPRCPPGAAQAILQQLATCGLLPDETPLWQSARSAAYAAALAQLQGAALAYPCACSRKDIAAFHAAHGAVAARGAELPYPGTCRPERGGLHGRPARAWRLHTSRCQGLLPAAMGAARVPAQNAAPGQAQHAAHSAPSAVQHAAHNMAPGAPGGTTGGELHWQDRRLGAQRQNVPAEVGDFVLRRADGLWAYQLAVVVDDAAQGITHIVRGEDLADNTPRQILLQTALGLPTPQYLHTPLVRAANGEKLSKQNGAAALDTRNPLAALNAAAQVLHLPPAPAASGLPDALAHWTRAWGQAWAGIKKDSKP